MADASLGVSGSPRKFRVTPCQDCGTPIEKIGSAKRCKGCAKEKKREQDRRYASGRRAEIAERARQWYWANRERANAASRAYHWNNVDREAKRRKDRYYADPEAARAKSREWYAANRERVLARMATTEGRWASASRMQERLSRNPQFKVHSNMSRAVRRALGGKGRAKWEGLVGYTAVELKVHLERQFARGMTWDNYGRGAGKWHIDHIVPQSAFSFTSPDDPDFRACWALTNLRPLWGAENIRKHASRDFLI